MLHVRLPVMPSNEIRLGYICLDGYKIGNITTMSPAVSWSEGPPSLPSIQQKGTFLSSAITTFDSRLGPLFLRPTLHAHVSASDVAWWVFLETKHCLILSAYLSRCPHFNHIRDTSSFSSFLAGQVIFGADSGHRAARERERGVGGKCQHGGQWLCCRGGRGWSWGAIARGSRETTVGSIPTRRSVRKCMSQVIVSDRWYKERRLHVVVACKESLYIYTYRWYMCPYERFAWVTYIYKKSSTGTVDNTALLYLLYRKYIEFPLWRNIIMIASGCNS